MSSWEHIIWKKTTNESQLQKFIIIPNIAEIQKYILNKDL